MDAKLTYYQRSEKIKANGWKQTQPDFGDERESVTEQDDKSIEITAKEESSMMFEKKMKVPGPGEPSYIPPVVTLPAEVGCTEYLVMSTLKKQSFGETYDPDKSINRGTIFPALDLPFMGQGGKGGASK